MTRSPSAEPPKVTKRKGTRSVSTLTPSQLARKRANDREAQRAIRARTKEHIERLERELEELKAHQCRDETVKGLMARNKKLEGELVVLREKLQRVGGLSASHYPAPVYEDTVSRSSSAMSNQEYNSVAEHLAGQYIPVSEPCAPWPAALVSCSVASTVSTVSSPGSTANDEYAYLTSNLPRLPDGSRLPPTSIPIIKAPEDEYDELENEAVYPRSQATSMPAHYVTQPPWNVYPGYYPSSPATGM